MRLWSFGYNKKRVADWKSALVVKKCWIAFVNILPGWPRSDVKFYIQREELNLITMFLSNLTDYPYTETQIYGKFFNLHKICTYVKRILIKLIYLILTLDWNSFCIYWLNARWQVIGSFRPLFGNWVWATWSVSKFENLRLPGTLELGFFRSCNI